MVKLFKYFFFKIKNKELEVHKDIKGIDTFIYFFNKVYPYLIIGLYKKIFSKNIKGLVFIGRNVKLLHKNNLFMEKNCYIGDYSFINCLSLGGIKLGRNVTIREFAWIQLSSGLKNPGEYIEIKDYTYIGPYVKIGAAAPIIIGEKCQIGAGVSFIGENHEFQANKDIFEQGVTREGINVGNGCWIGNNVIILDGVSIGEGSVIGAGSVVTKSIPPGSIAVGNPSRIIRKRN